MVTTILATAALLLIGQSGPDQSPATVGDQTGQTVTDGKWRPPNVDTSGAAAAPGTAATSGAAAPSGTAAPSGAAADSNSGTHSLDAQQVRNVQAAVPVRSGGKDMLPNDQGQVWRQYDISAYTKQVKGTEAPEQAIIDWILRETGTEVWFTRPLGLLSADRDTLHVYHTPEMQQLVADVVGRFVNGTQEAHVLGVRLVTIDSPNWRTLFLHRLQPVPVQSAGIDAWLSSKEDAALLLAELRRRPDYREHSAMNLAFYNGQTQSMSQLRPRPYIRSFPKRMQNDTWMGYDVERGQIQEGFALQVSPLLSQDERTIDAVIKCTIDQVEKLVAVPVDLPGYQGQMQRAEIQVPQLVSWRLHERFRWPAGQVLLLSCGVIAAPGPTAPATLGIPNPFARGGGRADALMLLESQGKAAQALVTGTTTIGGPGMQQGARY